MEVKGLGYDSLSCSSSISEVTTGPKLQHKDARWIRGIVSLSPPFSISFNRNMFCAQGSRRRMTEDQIALARPPCRSPLFFLTLTYSDMSFFLLLKLVELIFLPGAVTLTDNRSLRHD